jgi:sulfate permease, SulP family
VLRAVLPSRGTIAEWIPAIDWIPRYQRGQLPGDLIAGLIVAVMLVPQSMAYALLAGLPPQVGLYASILPLVIYGLLGTSRSLGVGPTAIASLLTASAVGTIATVGTDEYVAIALLLTVMVGIIRIVMGLVRAGFLVNFLSHPVLSGFVNAAALMIAASQIANLFGLNVERNDTFFEQISAAVRGFGTASAWTAAIGIGSVLLLLYFQRLGRRHLELLGMSAGAATLTARTGPLLTAILATVIVGTMGLDERADVAVVGDVPGGLPPLTVPDIQPDYVQTLLPAAIIISLVGFMESISIAKSLASRERDRVEPNQELIAIGAANVGAAFTGGFTVTGSFSRSVLNYAAGATSGLASMVTAGVVLLAVLVLTPLFFYLPNAALAAIVIVSVAGLLETRTFRKTWTYRHADAATLVITFVTVLVLGIEIGLLIGILASIVVFLWRTSHPNIVELGRVKGTDIYRNVRRYDTETHPEILLLRVDESLYFANTQRLQDEVMTGVRERPDVNHLVLVGSSINDVDASALETLEELTLQLAAGGVTTHLAAFKLTVLERLRGTLLLQLIGPSRIHTTVNDAVDAIQSAGDAQERGDEDMDSADVAESKSEA